MQTLLLRALLTWAGREKTQSSFEAKGFLAHRKWQERVVDFCGAAHAAAEVNRYWDEVSREIVCSAGKCAPQIRKFSVEPGYRSSYLDELAARKEFAHPELRYPPLLKCLYEYVRESGSVNYVANETTFFENPKLDEAAKLSISSKGWTGRKRDAVPFANKFGDALGYASKRGRLLKVSPSGLVFEFRVDLGGNPNCVGRPPLAFRIYHLGDVDFAFNIVLFDQIVPGFDKYGYCASPATYVLGILAHIELFDALFGSLSAFAESEPAVGD
jgi:hypothetical protein